MFRAVVHGVQLLEPFDGPDRGVVNQLGGLCSEVHRGLPFNSKVC